MIGSRRNFFLGSSALLASIRTVQAPARAADFEIKCGGTLPLEHPNSIRGKQMWAAVERECGGRVRVQYFPDSQLGSDSSVFGQMRVGAVQFLCCPPSISSSLVPASGILDIGFAFKDVPEALRATDGPLGEYIRKEYVAKGIYALPKIWDSGMRQITSSSHAIRSVDDVAGFKIRTVENKITVDLFKTIGASPTPMARNELYTALQTHIVDGCELPLVSIQSGRIFEVQKYLSLTNDSWSCVLWLTTVDFWKRLPPDIQNIIERNAAKYVLPERADTARLNNSVADQLVREGMSLTANPNQASFRARLGTYYEYWKNAFGATEWSLLQNAVSGKLT